MANVRYLINRLHHGLLILHHGLLHVWLLHVLHHGLLHVRLFHILHLLENRQEKGE